MATVCPYCNIEVSESSIEAEDGCCPECGSVISATSSFLGEDEDEDGLDYDDTEEQDIFSDLDDEDEFERDEFDDDVFDDEEFDDEEFDDEEFDEEEEEEVKIVRTKKFDIKPMYPEDACVQMELLGHSFYVFCNAETDQVNVVYRRKGNTYGLIEPEV